MAVCSKCGASKIFKKGSIGGGNGITKSLIKSYPPPNDTDNNVGTGWTELELDELDDGMSLMGLRVENNKALKRLVVDRLNPDGCDLVRPAGVQIPYCRRQHDECPRGTGNCGG